MCVISRLVLRNWRSHENTELVFGKGTNVIVGAMGSGKSSAINGICFGLFGTFPDLQSRKLRLDDVVMNKPAQKSEASVTVEFVVDGKTYSITRRIKRGKSAAASTAELRLDGNLVEGPQPSRVDERVAELLRLDYDLFSRAIYSEQNAIDYFLEIPKGQRKQRIDELLKISKFEGARKTLGTVVSRLRDRAGEAERVAAGAGDFSEIPSLRQAVTDGELQLVTLKARLSSLASSLVEARAGVDDAARKRRLFRELENGARLAEGAAASLKERLGKLARPLVARGELEQKVGELQKERKLLEAAKREIEKLEREYERENSLSNSLFDQLERAGKKLASLQAVDAVPLQERMVELEADEKKANGELFAAKHELAQLAGDLESLHRGKDRCPVCETQLSGEKISGIASLKESRKRELGARATELEAQLVARAESRKEVSANLTAAQRASGERTALEAGVAQIKPELERSARRQKEVTVALSGLRLPRMPDEVDAELRVLEKALEYYGIEAELAGKLALAEEAKSKAASVGYDETRESAALERAKELEKEHALASQEQGSLAGLLVEKRKRLSELEAARVRVERARDESRQLGDNVSSFEQLQKALGEVQSSLRQEFTEETNVALTEVWRHVYPYGDYGALRLGVDEGGDYVLQLSRRDGAWVNVEGVTSGGERSTACLALRIALSLVLTQNLSWLILDEPTHNLDKNGIKELARTLREHLPKLVEQVFIITHEEELESAASGNVYRFEREKEADEPTRVLVED